MSCYLTILIFVYQILGLSQFIFLVVGQPLMAEPYLQSLTHFICELILCFITLKIHMVSLGGRRTVTNLIK